jgi:CheY-like chemotaxis protein
MPDKDVVEYILGQPDERQARWLEDILQFYTKWYPVYDSSKYMEVFRVLKKRLLNIVEQDREAIDKNGYGILVCDDSILVRKMVSRIMTDGMNMIYLAMSGDQAMEVLKENHKFIQLVLLDVVMEGMDGVEVLTKIMSDYPNVLVVMMSSVQDENMREVCKSLGAVDWITKPVKTDIYSRIMPILWRNEKGKKEELSPRSSRENKIERKLSRTRSSYAKPFMEKPMLVVSNGSNEQPLLMEILENLGIQREVWSYDKLGEECQMDMENSKSNYAVIIVDALKSFPNVLDYVENIMEMAGDIPIILIYPENSAVVRSCLKHKGDLYIISRYDKRDIQYALERIIFFSSPF